MSQPPCHNPLCAPGEQPRPKTATPRTRSRPLHGMPSDPVGWRRPNALDGGRPLLCPVCLSSLVAHRRDASNSEPPVQPFLLHSQPPSHRRLPSLAPSPRPSPKHTHTVNVHMPKDRITSVHQNYGFVEFLGEDDAEYAIKVRKHRVLVHRPLALPPRSSEVSILQLRPRGLSSAGQAALL